MALPALVQFMIRNAAIGASLGVVVGLGLMFGDAWGLATLAGQTESPLVAWIMLPWGLAVTFGGVQVGIAIMVAEDDSPGGGKRQRIPLASGATRRV